MNWHQVRNSVWCYVTMEYIGLQVLLEIHILCLLIREKNSDIHIGIAERFVDKV